MIVKQLLCDSCGRVITGDTFRATFQKSMKGKGKVGKRRQFDYDQECWELLLRRVSQEAKDALNKSATFTSGKS